MGNRELSRVRKITFSLPEVNERPSHGAPSFFFRDKRPICYFHDSDFSSDGRISIWCPASAGAREELVAADPQRFFAPTPSSSGVFKDWIGAFVDDSPDWSEIAEVIEDAFRHVAPKKVTAKFDAANSS